MLCESNPQGMLALTAGYRPEKIQRIRDKIRIVFGRDCAVDDFYLARDYDLTETGELVMIVR